MRSSRHFQIAVMVIIGLFFVFSQAAYAEDPPPNQEQMYTYGGCVELVESTARVPKTGQVLCWDEHGVKIDCIGTGQDPDPLLPGGVEWPDPRFTDNADGTITDNLTGLMWLMDAGCFETSTWSEALDIVADFNTNPSSYNCTDYMDSYTDWRLPNLRELQSLIHYGFVGLALPNTEGTGQWSEGDPFTNVQSGYYWSSTTYASTTVSAWDVLMYYGYVGYHTKDEFNYHVWPVRGGN